MSTDHGDSIFRDTIDELNLGSSLTVHQWDFQFVI